MSPAWKKRLTVEGGPGRARAIQLAIYDAAHCRAAADTGHSQRMEEGSEGVERRASLLERLIRRSAPSSARSGLDGLQAGEVTSDDLVGGVVVDVSALCHSSRHWVTQRLPIRHPSDGDIDRRLHRLSAHLLVTVQPSHAPPSTTTSPHLSPRQSSASSLSAPTCRLPFPAVYRLLCLGSVFWKFPFHSTARPQPRLVFFSRHPLSSAQLSQQLHSTWDPLSDTSPLNPLFPLGLLYWSHPTRRRCSASRCLPLHSITGLYEECQTPAFTALLNQQERTRRSSLSPPSASPPSSTSSSSLPSLSLDCSFSIVSRERTLDLVAESRDVRDAFLFGLHSLLTHQGRLWYSDTSHVEEKREEEKRRYNEKQTQQLTALSFAIRHLPLQHKEGTQVRLVLSRAAPTDGDSAKGEPPTSALQGLRERRGELIGQSEWADVEESITFLTLFFLPLPDSSTGLSSAGAEYELHVYDLSHLLLAQATFSAALLLHPHIDIPLSLRHRGVESMDRLLTFHRSCCQMRVKPIAGPDVKKGDLLDVMTLLQAQPSYNPALPYLTLSFMMRGEECTLYPEPSFVVTPTVLLYLPTTQCLAFGGQQLPLSSIVTAQRQLRPSSSLSAALCEAHPEKRVNSKRMLVLECGEEGRHVLEMRSVLSADAWLCGIRQLRRKKGIPSRSALETEELHWTTQGGRDQEEEEEEEEGMDSNGHSDGDSNSSQGGEEAEEESTSSNAPIPSSALSVRGGDRPSEGVDWSDVWALPQAVDGVRGRGEAAWVWDGEEEESEELRIDSAHYSFGAPQPGRGRGHRRDGDGLHSGDGEGEAEGSSGELESPTFHASTSPSSSFNSRRRPGLSPPLPLPLPGGSGGRGL